MPKLSEQMRHWIHLQHPGTGQTENQAWWQYMILDLVEKVEAYTERPDILGGKCKAESPVDRQLVEEALEAALALKAGFAGFVDGSWMGEQFVSIIALLRRALERDSNVQD